MPHAGRGPKRAVEASVIDHFDDRRDAATLLADEPRPRPAELHLRRGVGPVAELVLQSLKVNAVALAVRGEPRHEEARQPAGSLRKHQERVAHRRGEEPLVTGDLILGTGAAAVER